MMRFPSSRLLVGSIRFGPVRSGLASCCDRGKYCVQLIAFSAAKLMLFQLFVLALPQSRTAMKFYDLS